MIGGGGGGKQTLSQKDGGRYIVRSDKKIWKEAKLDPPVLA